MKTLIALLVASAVTGGFPAGCIDAYGNPHVSVRYRHLPGNIGGEAYIGECKIVLDRRRWSQRIRCGLLAHELMHLKGFRDPVGYHGDHLHSPNPRSLMYPVLTPRNIPKQCKKRFKRQSPVISLP